MNAITKAISEIRIEIPIEVLELAFLERSEHVNTLISLDEIIMNKVIRKRVLVDANLVGGVSVDIPVWKCNTVQLSNHELLINVPKELTANRAIISPVMLRAGSIVTGDNAATANIDSVLSSTLGSVSTHKLVQTSRLELVGDNIVIAEGISSWNNRVILNCSIENDSNLNNLLPVSYLAFSELAIYAVKAYIRNTLRIRLAKGYIYGGHELSTITEVIEEYADSNELYKNYLRETWTKVQFMNSSSDMTDTIGMMISGT